MDFQPLSFLAYNALPAKQRRQYDKLERQEQSLQMGIGQLSQPPNSLQIKSFKALSPAQKQEYNKAVKEGQVPPLHLLSHLIPPNEALYHRKQAQKLRDKNPIYADVPRLEGTGKFSKIRKIRNQPLYEVKLYVRTLKEARATVKMHSMTGGMMQEEPAEQPDEQPDEDDENIGYQQATLDEAIAQTPADQATEDIQTPLPAIQAEDEPTIAEFFDVLLREYPPGSVANRRQAYFEITGVFGRELPQIIANTFYDLWG